MRIIEDLTNMDPEIEQIDLLRSILAMFASILIVLSIILITIYIWHIIYLVLDYIFD